MDVLKINDDDDDDGWKVEILTFIYLIEKDYIVVTFLKSYFGFNLFRLLRIKRKRSLMQRKQVCLRLAVDSLVLKQYNQSKPVVMLTVDKFQEV